MADSLWCVGGRAWEGKQTSRTRYASEYAYGVRSYEDGRETVTYEPVSASKASETTVRTT